MRRACISCLPVGADYHPLSSSSADSGFRRRFAGETALATDFLHTGRWLRKDKELRLEEQKVQRSGKDAKSEKPGMATWSNGWTAGRMTASMKDSSNAVMRM